MTRITRALAAAASLLLLAALAQVLLEAVDARALPLRGRLVDVGGHRLRLLESGADQSGPTVVLECGIGGATSASWGWIQRGVERFAPVVSYDRAGLGGSEPGPMPRDGARLVEELHALLQHSGHPAPYVFVGHSYGGLLARLFAERYPGEIAGAVLVDSSHPWQFGDTTARPPRRRGIQSLVGAAPWVARLGLMRIAVRVLPMDVKHLPPLERREQMAFFGRVSEWQGVVREMAAWRTLTNPEAAQTRGFGDAPLAVISADHGTSWGGWMTLQEQIAKLSSNSVGEVEKGSTHGGLLSDSLYAARVVQAIHAVRDAAVTHTRVVLPPATR